MKPQEIEIWARDIVESVLSGQSVEDSRIELKAQWIEPEKAAPRLGGHANAARGENILWLIGVDERNNSLTSVDATEKGDWYKSVEKCFDGFAPRLLNDVNFKVNGNAIVALYFDTEIEAPFVVKNPKGGFPEHIVPWREGTDLRAAKRENLLKILIPKKQISALIFELEFNKSVWKFVESGYWFHEREFLKALETGLINELPNDVKKTVIESYVAIHTTNEKCRKFFQERELGFQIITREFAHAEQVIKDELKITLKKVTKAINQLYKFQQIR